MSIAVDIKDSFPHGEISTIRVNKNEVFHGEQTTTVIVDLYNGKRITGKFTNEPKAAFGGIEFVMNKDIPGLMVAKIKSVLRGSAE